MQSRSIFSRLIIFIFAILFTVSCDEDGSSPSGSDDPTVTEQSAKLRLSEVSYSATVAIIEYTSGTDATWSASIDDDYLFVSFNNAGYSTSTTGSTTGSSSTNILYLYLNKNTSYFSRTATITFTFDGGKSFEMELTQLSEDETVSPYNSKGEPMWAEIPAMHEDDSKGYLYIYHNTATEAGVEVRNFSLCYDPENHAAAWVAYPFHNIYDGSVGRNEDWEYDPLLPESIQPNLNSSYSGSYDRGHQMASADRQATVAMNKQTFYFSNMTPQLGTLNQNIWAALESKVRDQKCSDTLYVVTGADYTTSIGSTTDRDGKVCPLPGAYYKVILRTRSGTSGKAVSECTADELKAVGFWYEHRSYSSLATPVSVAEIEERTGFTFFTTVPEEVKSTYDSSLWSFE